LSFTGRFVCVFVDKATMRATPIPPPFRALADEEALLAARLPAQ
jgi:acyl-CoA thioesterase FadM